MIGKIYPRYPIRKFQKIMFSAMVALTFDHADLWTRRRCQINPKMDMWGPRGPWTNSNVCSLKDAFFTKRGTPAYKNRGRAPPPPVLFSYSLHFNTNSVCPRGPWTNSNVCSLKDAFFTKRGTPAYKNRGRAPPPPVLFSYSLHFNTNSVCEFFEKSNCFEGQKFTPGWAKY